MLNSIQINDSCAGRMNKGICHCKLLYCWRKIFGMSGNQNTQQFYTVMFFIKACVKEIKSWCEVINDLLLKVNTTPWTFFSLRYQFTVQHGLLGSLSCIRASCITDIWLQSYATVVQLKILTLSCHYLFINGSKVKERSNVSISTKLPKGIRAYICL